MLRLAEDELNRAAAALADEAAGWPDETDCDRLDRVEEILRDRGILLWQVSPCCDTCTCGELSSRLEAIDQRAPGFSERARGYTFFIDQNLPGNLADGSQISVYLAYGHLLPSDAIKTPKEGVQYSLDIAREVCDCLRNAGFDADWNGSYARKIRLPLNWQRRTRLQ